ncbi:uncharacterized protein C8Q71DRAFT_150500 [Rhodofomes roseus]|uniref:Uncharacterized protein n=1 Tax=Rhodofomes roseus TaxID=34475 RepID=A0ABQ8KBH0_9APHY|nr:uncharacterized protein C8Q71DRAFT_150500 [Rhodofomes roseus]KAH9834614.1 hypothetical protein C8Q71DRAFT_150500 [Rhodofomes roseus]
MIAPPIAGGAEVMEVRRVSLEQNEVIRSKYHIHSEETMISSAVLIPGNYGCYYLPGKELQDVCSRSLLHSFRTTMSMDARKKRYENAERQTAAATGCLKRYIIPDELLAEASSRDADGNCVFMGYTDKNSQYTAKFDWIFPPGMARFRTHGPQLLTTEEFSSSQNLMMARTDIYRLWHSNAFSVDVDDDYRICVFDKSAINQGLPSRIDPVLNSAAERFLREHFRFTLSVSWGGGDANEEHAVPGQAVVSNDAPSNGEEEESNTTDNEQEDFVSEVTARLEALQG